jgi:DNA modification methylase
MLNLDIFYIGDVLSVLKTLPDKIVRCIVTSPPYYGLRDYGTATWTGGDEKCDHKHGGQVAQTKHLSAKDNFSTGMKPGKDASICIKCGAIRIDQQIGLEKTPEQYIEKLVQVFKECRRVLKDDGTLWLNIGDSYWGGKGMSGSRDAEVQEQRNKNGESINAKHQQMGGKGMMRPTDAKHNIIKPKDLIGIPWMLAFALRADGWYLRSDIIWNKRNPMPESVTDRPTKAHEYIFLLTKSAKYYYDQQAIMQPIAESVINDKRLYDENYATGRPDRGFPGGNSQGSGLLKRKSGNSERKDRPDAPENFKGNQQGSVPWEGMLANKKSVWTITTKPFKDAHFATFPEDLIVDCIKAGTSEHGQCSTCGKAWKRVVEKTNQVLMEHGSKKMDIAVDRHVKRDSLTVFKKNDNGWQPQCNCNSHAEADIVLDPFSGAGTTALVVKKLQRNFIGIEINAKYVREISVPRLQSELGMFYEPKVVDLSQMKQLTNKPI